MKLVWTESEDLQLEVWRLAGWTSNQMAPHLPHRTLVAIRTRLQVLGLHWMPDKGRWAEALGGQGGKPDAVLARELGVTVYAVHQARYRLRKGGFNFTDRRKVNNYRRGKTFKKVKHECVGTAGADLELRGGHPSGVSDGVGGGQGA